MRVRFALAAIALAACAQAQARPPASEAGWQKIEIIATPLALSKKLGIGAHVGALIFRGGLQLKSPNAMFGGWSGLEMDGDGRVISVSDTGAFLSAAIDTDASGNLVGVSDGKIGIVRDEKGQPYDGKSLVDAEDITRLTDGRYAVSFEQRHRIQIYDLAKNGPAGAAVDGPPVPQDMAPNEGIEALTQAPEGDLIAGREFSLTHKPPTDFYKLKLDGGGMIAGPAQVKRDYALVGLRPLPDGDYIALERYYFPLIGMRASLQRFRASGLTAAKPHLDGPELANLKKLMETDNFEGLALAPLKDGGVRLYIISDDNFSKTQRTLLFAFDLPGSKMASKPKAAP
ncbi:MAG: esterase-like activity of phytase family protein [Alphaproteobacteria bacterium]